MASTRTLMDLLQPGKRPKLSSSSNSSIFSSASSQLKALSSSPTTVDAKCSSNQIDTQSSSSLTIEQKSRIELNKSQAKSKLNLKICSEKVFRAKTDGVNFVKLEELLVDESWLEVLPGELEKPYANNLFMFVEKEICSGSVAIYPPQHLIFNALNSTPFDRVKVVIIGQDPYHGPGQAMGLSFSVPEGVKVPSSLVNIYKELQKDLGCSIPSHGNLMKWAVQGVLLLNTVLTVRSHQANSHAKKGWEQFTDAVIKTISQDKQGVTFLLWGNSAQEKSRWAAQYIEKLSTWVDVRSNGLWKNFPVRRTANVRFIDETKHNILKAAHPSGLSAHRGFFGCRHFSRTNQILEKLGETPIDWQL